MNWEDRIRESDAGKLMPERAEEIIEEGRKGEETVEVKEVKMEVTGYMNDIVSCFEPGVKITVMVHAPNFPDRDFIMTSDTIINAIAVLERLGPDPCQTF